MKKLLSILASVTLVASSSAAVVSCTSSSKKNTSDSYANNNLNNILAASEEKAKQVIINNEYGIDPSQVALSQSRIKVSDEGYKDLDYDELKNNKNTMADQLVNQYYGDSRNDNTNTQTGSHIDLDGTNGVTSTLDYLLDKVLDAFSFPPIVKNAIFRGKSDIISVLNLTKQSMNMTNLNEFNISGYNQAISGSEYIINAAITIGLNYIKAQLRTEADTNGTWHTVAKAIAKVLNNKELFTNVTLPNIFGDNKVRVDKDGKPVLPVADADKGTNKTMMLIRDIMSSLFDKKKLQDSIYNNQPISFHDFSGEAAEVTLNPKQMVSQFGDGRTDIESVNALNGAIKVKDIKKELIYSLDRLINIVFNPDLFNKTESLIEDSNKDSIEDDFILKTSTIIETLISSTGSTPINKLLAKNMLSSDEKSVKPTEQTIMAFIWEGLRDMCLINGQFSMLEDSFSVTPKDSEHLFGDMTNSEYINNDDKKHPENISDLSYFKAKDEPININYFFSNLNYYIGALKDKDNDSAYRLQRLLFVIFNDPSDNVENNKTSSNSWVDKQSDLLDLVVNVGVKVAQDYFKLHANDSDTNKKIADVLGSLKEADLTTLEDSFLKPIILGLINGKSLQPIFDVIEGGIRGASTIPAVNTLFDSLKALGINMDDILKAISRFNYMGIGEDTIHNLITDDLRKVFEPLKFIPQEWMDKLFGPDKPVNLFTIFEMPLSKILSMLGVSGFDGGKISPIGDVFTTKSIPWLINYLNEFLNGRTSDVTPTRYIADGDDATNGYVHSLKTRDINFQGIYDLFISIVGSSHDNDGSWHKNDATAAPAADAQPQENIFSVILHDLISTPDEMVHDDLSNLNVKLDPSKFVNDMGIVDQSVEDGNTTTPSTKYDVAFSSSELGEGFLKDDKTIEFDNTNGLTSDFNIDPAAEELDAKKGTLGVSVAKSGASVSGIASAKLEGNKLTITLKDAVKHQVRDSTVNVYYWAPGIKPNVLIPTYNAESASIKVSGTNPNAVIDLAIRKNSLIGSFYRLNLPEIELDKESYSSGYKGDKTTFNMNSKYMNIDFLHSNYVSLIKVLNDFNSSAYYLSFVNQILINDQAFKFEADPKSIKYFKDNKGLIKSLNYSVTFKNYVVGTTNTYLFSVSRNSNMEGFKIDKIITNKID